jgi:hypothetical protein
MINQTLPVIYVISLHRLILKIHPRKNHETIDSQ